MPPPPGLRKLAEASGLDLPAFDRCLSEAKTRAAVAQDVEAGNRLGLTGTPTFFINGRPLVGGHPFEAFTAVIDEELSAAPKQP
jgi:protein-disulfide isomerase